MYACQTANSKQQQTLCLIKHRHQPAPYYPTKKGRQTHLHLHLNNRRRDHGSMPEMINNKEEEEEKGEKKRRGETQACNNLRLTAKIRSSSRQTPPQQCIHAYVIVSNVGSILFIAFQLRAGFTHTHTRTRALHAYMHYTHARSRKRANKEACMHASKQAALSA